MDESIERSMNISSEFSGGYRAMDEDVLNYLSTLSPQQQKLLDDFVSFSDPAAVMPMPQALPKFAYGNSVGANHYSGRPVSVYEPFVPESEFSSLPPDLVSCNDPRSFDLDCQKYSWEAEDTEYIETLRDNFEHQSTSNYAARAHYEIPSATHTIVADVHYQEVVEDDDAKTISEHVYATVHKPKKHLDNQMIASDRSASDPPREKFPKIMTESCYGELNNPDLLWNSYEQDLVQSMENIAEDGNHQVISSLMTDSSIIDGVSSINSSIYEQIPSMTSSINEMQRSANSQRKIVKWWDDHHEHTEESTLDLNGMAEEGELMFQV